MVSLTATCLTCERDFKISEKEINLAKSFLPQTGEKALISCGCCSAGCGTVYELPPEVPDSTAGIKEWIIKQVEDEEAWLQCIPLRGIVAVEPIARNELPPKSGRFFYKPGGGQEDEEYPDGYPRRIYMFRFGVDPLVIWKLMHPKELTPVVIGS